MGIVNTNSSRPHHIPSSPMDKESPVSEPTSPHTPSLPLDSPDLLPWPNMSLDTTDFNLFSTSDDEAGLRPTTSEASVRHKPNPPMTTTPVHMYYCGTAGTTMELAENLRSILVAQDTVQMGEFGPLNNFHPENHDLSDIALLLVVTTGQMGVPTNGQQFLNRISALPHDLANLNYLILGIGDSGYQARYNAAARTVYIALQAQTANCICADGVFEVDVLIEIPPLTGFYAWLGDLGARFDSKLELSMLDCATRNIYIQQKNMLAGYEKGAMRFDEEEHHAGRMLLVQLEIPEPDFEDMGHVRLLPRNSVEMVERVLQLLGVDDRRTLLSFSQHLDDKPVQESVEIVDFLTKFVDLYEPFHDLDWVDIFNIDETDLNDKSTIEVLEAVFRTLSYPPPDPSFLRNILFSMPLLKPRYYSIASSSYNNSQVDNHNCTLDLLVRIIPDGRFSHHCISQFKYHGKIKYLLSHNSQCEPLLDLKDKPLVAVACGTGFGSVRSLIQRRIKQRNKPEYADRAKIMLFLGYRVADREIFQTTVNDAAAAGILDGVYLVPSNEEKMRVQDCFEEFKEELKTKLVDEGGYIYICGCMQVVNGVKEKMEIALGTKNWLLIQDRVISEVF